MRVRDRPTIRAYALTMSMAQVLRRLHFVAVGAQSLSVVRRISSAVGQRLDVIQFRGRTDAPFGLAVDA